MKQYLALILLLLAGCGGEHSAPVERPDGGDAETPLVTTVNYPLYWMATALAADAATVVFPAPAGSDPAFWQPDIDTLLRYQRSDLVLLNGAGYARWIASTSLPYNRLVDTSAAYRELAFTTWLDLELAQRQAQAVAAALQRLLPAETAAIEQRLLPLQQTLAEADAALARLGRQLADTPVLYSHPVYQYLQRRYRLNGHALHWEPDQVPDEDEWRALAALLASHPARLMLWEAPPLAQVAERLGDMGITVAVFPPMGNRPAQGDFAANLAAAIESLAVYAAK